MKTIAIRRAVAADAAVLAELAMRTFNDTFAGVNTPADMAAHNARTYGIDIQRAEIAAPSIRTLLAERDGHTIAYAQLRDEAVPGCVATRPTIELWRIYVDKAAIGAGVARELMAAVLAEAAASGAKSLWLGVWERNSRAISFYRKFAFVEVGSHRFTLGSDVQNDLIFERALASPAI
jgi:ribosomal protein S18 acetylase RimI-like enzyme